jgi:lysophospholipase L1-like esterase
VVAGVDTKVQRQRSLKRRLCYAAIPTILAFLMVEGLFRLYFLARIDDPVGREYEHLSHCPAYASKPWFSREFVASFSATGQRGFPGGGRLVFPRDQNDQFCTVRNGIRATVGFDPRRLPPGRQPRKLFVLGGSTTLCLEVPDGFTYASQLQERLAAIPETRDIEVVNCAVGGAVTLEEVERLEYEIGRNNIPTFCIFFDGINDANQGVFNGNPGSTPHEEKRVYEESGLLSTLKRIARLSVAVRTIYYSVLDSQSRNDPVHTRSEAKVRELAKATADCYERNMLRGKEICDRHGIRMIVFLQPHVFSIGGRPWTFDERAAAASMRKGMADGLRVCYPLLREKLSRLRQQGIMAYDISDAFNDNLEPIFVDEFHVESTGNRLIAEAILKRVLPVLKGLSPSLAIEPDRRPER